MYGQLIIILWYNAVYFVLPYELLLRILFLICASILHYKAKECSVENDLLWCMHAYERQVGYETEMSGRGIMQ